MLYYYAHRDRNLSSAYVRRDHVRRSAAAGGRLLKDIDVAVCAVAKQYMAGRYGVSNRAVITVVATAVEIGDGMGRILNSNFYSRLWTHVRPWGRALVVSRKTQRTPPLETAQVCRVFGKDGRYIVL